MRAQLIAKGMTAPGQTTFFRVLSSVDGDALDRALRDWAASHCDPEGALALDGKRVRGASRQMDGNENCHLIAALSRRRHESEPRGHRIHGAVIRRVHGTHHAGKRMAKRLMTALHLAHVCKHRGKSARQA